MGKSMFPSGPDHESPSSHSGEQGAPDELRSSHDSDKDAGGLSSDSVQPAPHVSNSRRMLCAIGVVAVVLSALYNAPSEPLASGVASASALLHTFLATLFLCLGFLSNRSSNVVANHGGIGIVAGLSIALIFEAQLKAGAIFFLFGAFPGLVFGLVVGMIRSHGASANKERDTTAGED